MRMIFSPDRTKDICYLSNGCVLFDGFEHRVNDILFAHGRVAQIIKTALNGCIIPSCPDLPDSLNLATFQLRVNL
jgi:hypothetical protein